MLRVIKLLMLGWTVGCLATGSPLLADTFYPMIMSLNPVAVQVGTTAECTVFSRYTMHDAYQVWVSGSGVQAEVIRPKLKGKNKRPHVTSLRVRFTVAPDAPLGVREFRVATPRGVSTVGQLVVVAQPVVVEKGNNNSLNQAQKVQLPAAICGRLERNEDVDMFRFQAKRGQAFTFHVRCMRLQNKIHDLQTHADPILVLRNQQGSILATSDNYFVGDPCLAYEFDRDGEYVLEIRDVRYQGDSRWVYVIEVWEGPFVINIHPQAVQPGAEVEVQLVGFHIRQPRLRWKVPQLAPGVHWVQLPLKDRLSNPVRVYVSDLPVSVEPAEQAADMKSAPRVSVPGGICGCISQEGQVDYYRFEAKRGQAFTVEVFARRLQSALDPHLRILNAQGRPLALNDDMRYLGVLIGDSYIERWVAPADGEYVIELRDLHLRGGPEYLYHIRVTPAEPGFRLLLDTSKTILVPGVGAPIFVRAQRYNGFQGEIELEVQGVPEGVQVHAGRILPNLTDGCILLEASKDAKAQLAQIRIFGRAKVKQSDGQEKLLRVEAHPRQETYMPGGGRGHWPVLTHMLSITSPEMDIRGMKIQPQQITLRPGESKRVEVEIVRSAELKKNVTLAVVFFHLSSRFGNVLPPGVSLQGNQSKILLTANESKGYITLKAAPGAKPVQRQLVPVMAHVSINFVMKSTYARPLWVTIVSPEK